ncbi:hypothetical protein YC2023_028191 [Brassica napus]
MSLKSRATKSKKVERRKRLSNFTSVIRICLYSKLFVVEFRTNEPTRATTSHRQHKQTINYHSNGGVDELEFINRCRDAGVVHIMGNTVIRARRQARFYKKIAIDYVYAFLRKICREHSVIFNVPQGSLLNVGQIFYV